MSSLDMNNLRPQCRISLNEAFNGDLEVPSNIEMFIDTLSKANVTHITLNSMIECDDNLRAIIKTCKHGKFYVNKL